MEIRNIVLGPRMERDEALRAGVEALIAAAGRRGVQLTIAPEPGAAPALIVGDAERNPHAAALGQASAHGQTCMPPDPHPHAFAIRPLGKRGLLLCGASPLAEAYGLFWLADRIAVTGDLPRRPVDRAPALGRRFFPVVLPTPDADDPPYVDRAQMAQGVARAKDDMRRALAFGASDILISSGRSAMPWEGAVEGPRSEEYAHWCAEVIDYAHQLHLRAFSISDEFLYQEEQLRRAGASLSPDDPAFWRALQARYRGFLRRLPALDGVGTRIGEIIPHGDLRAFDVIHNDSLLRLEEKYRRFMSAMYEVVVGEFGKEYYHRTWATNDHEQHSVPAILERILAGFPTERVIMSIKLTKTDQWYYQAFNPTIGVTPHETTVELELGHLYHGYNGMPCYHGEWLRAGLIYSAAHGAAGISVMGVGAPGASALGRSDSMPHTLWLEAAVYAAHRLAWNPHEDLTTITRDWATRHFGAAAAPRVARMLLLSDDAFVKGLYVTPYAATHAWNPLAHMRKLTFVLEGDPLWDEGRGHLAFLREIYWQCRPFLGDTLAELDAGGMLWRQGMRHWAAAEMDVADGELRAKVKQSLAWGRVLIELNGAYVRGWFRYFEYEEQPDSRRRLAAEAALREIEAKVAAYRETGGEYSLIAIEQFLETAHRGLTSAEEAARMAAAPTAGEIADRVAEHISKEAETLRAAGERALKILDWEGTVDGREMLTLTGAGEIEVEHIWGDSPSGVRCCVHGKVPPGWRAAIRSVEARGIVLVVEQPNADNGGRVVFCVDDPQTGSSRYRVELYAVPE